MEGKGFNVPEILQIKGYKYRAKMLIAGAVLLVVFILIISLIIHGIASAVRSVSTSHKDSDTAATASVSSSASAVSTTSSAVASASETVSSKAEPEYREEKFDADGKLIIDTDTLDGKKAVAITFDDGPSEYTKELIEGLNQRGARATFFMVGNCVEKYPDVLPLMVSGGHQLGNHTYDHTDIAAAGLSAAKESIEKTDQAIQNACGQISTAFRPPYGSYTDSIVKSIDKTVTIWSLDTVDWKSRDMGKIKNIIVSQCRDGSIVLLHDLYKTSVDGALAAIDQLQGEGFVFVTVNELMTRYGYPINPGAHSAQYAVYETNSPHAGEYKDDMERDKARDAASQASSSSGVFYYDRATDTDSQNSSDSDNGDNEYYQDDYYYDEEEDSDSIPIIETQSDSDRLVY